MNSSTNKGRILVAPLNWGLGHATRCIPVIKALEIHGFTPVIASDGDSLRFLQLEFPQLESLELPSYGIEYPKRGDNFKWKMLALLPRMIDAIIAEKKIVKKWIREYELDGIISDNRPGVFSKKVPSVFITHQLNVLTGNTTWFTGKIHRKIISKFSQCWVPDLEGVPNLSGRLGHMEYPLQNVKYIGPISRFTYKQTAERNDLLIMLSGPEPQRSIFEEKLRHEISGFTGSVIFVRGVIGENQEQVQEGNVNYFNFMPSEQLQKTIQESKAVVCRAGYTTLMDLSKLRKKALLIPTPGQYEQEYLARKVTREGLLPSVRQEKFRLAKLQELDLYPGLPATRSKINWPRLFGLFERKGELGT